MRSGHPRRTASSASRQGVQHGTLERSPRKEDPCLKTGVRYRRNGRLARGTRFPPGTGAGRVRIFYASGKRPNGALADSQVWRENLYLSLVDLGHDVVEFEHDLEPLLAVADFTVPANAAFVAEHRPAAEAALLAQISTTHA